MNKKLIRYKQRKLNREFTRFIVLNTILVFLILMTAILTKLNKNKVNELEDMLESFEYEESVESTSDVLVYIPESEEVEEQPSEESELSIEQYCRGLTEDDKYLLAKIIMAEAEGESLETKVLVGFVILNRVESTKFPNTIEEVIFQNRKNIYQFSPVMPGGRWWTTEPNNECWEAVEIIDRMEKDVSQGALYFEACKGESWHSRNLEFICKSDNTRFYKERD